MYIVEKQQLWYENILSYRTRVEEKDLPRLINHISTALDALELEKKGDIVFTIDEKFETDRTTILGVELLIPVNKVVDSSNIKPITDVYYLVRSICDDGCVLDLYLGTSGNIL